MNKIVAAASVVFLCAVSFAAGHAIALRKGASIVLDNTEMVAIWRESDWAVSSIRYAKMIKLVQTKQYDAAIGQACEAIAKDLKNMREIGKIGDVAPAPRVPAISEATYASSCK